jgi:glucose/arabinose dehydrogenase
VYQGASEIVNWASTGGNGQNVHIDEAAGFLYSGTASGVRRWAWSNTTDSGGTGQDVLTGQPTGGHGKHTVHVFDNWMYVMSGSSGNVTNPMAPSYDTQRSLIKRFNLASFTPGTPFAWASSGEVYADGLRNVLGFARDAMGRMYGVQNGQDDVTYGGQDVHNDNPGEVIVRLDQGSHHGYPFCFVAQRITNIAPGTQVRSEIFSGNTRDDAWCQSPANAARPVTFVQAHTAPMDITFYTGPWGALPDRWRNGAFVSLHGSWNREPASGYKVIWVPFNADGTSPMPTNTGNTTTFPYEVVLSGGNASGSVDGTWSVPGGESGVRPVGVAISPVDGALYISSDAQGYVYRVGLQR